MVITTDWHFEDKEKGVWVTMPEQDLPDASLTFRVDDVTPIDEMWGQEDFRPLRIIGNLIASGEPRGGFNPPLEVRVRYTGMDLYRAMMRGGRLTLAYWDTVNKRWQRYEEKGQCQYRLEPPDPCGYAYLELPSIGDPAISWGT